MKSTLNTKEAKKDFISFPRLGINDDKTNDKIVVLFTEPGVGTVVYSTSKYHFLGFYDEYWSMSDFIPFEGSVTLEG